jgi:catechol 2,3-dioxygenase-like lactoylglutathione lyase family enzyme
VEKQQFNVYLPPALVRRVKMRAIEVDESLSVFVETALTNRLGAEDGSAETPAHDPGQRPAGPMAALPIVYVTDMNASIAFYRALGFEPQLVGASWTVLGGGGTQLALHTASIGAQRARPLELATVSHEPLERVVARAEGAGLDIARGIADEAFGRSLLVRDPDGVVIQVNEHSTRNQG